MANEKLRILKMLEEGKINASEAARLLDGGTGTIVPGSNNGSQPRGSFATDDFATELSRKFDAFTRDLEPKLQRFSDAVVEKTADFADRISKSLEETKRASAAHAAATRSEASHVPASPYGGGFEKKFELWVSSGYNELNISGLNGDVLIHGYNGDKITATVSYKPKRSGAAIELMKLGTKYFLNYDDSEFDRVAIDAYVPSNLFSIIRIGDINGNVDLSSFSAETIIISNSNGATKLKTLSANSVQAECGNGKLTIQDIFAKNAQMENFNGLIDVLDMDSENVKLISVNGGITLNMSAYQRFVNYVWAVETSNGKMTLNLPAAPDLGYHVKAHASLGQVKLGLVNLNYITNSSSMTEAKSIAFDGCGKKVKLILETSNGSLQIN